MTRWPRAGLLLILSMSSGIVRAGDTQPNAADLVREVRAGESWVDHVASLRISLNRHGHTTPEGMAYHMADLKRRFPESQPTRQQFPWLIQDSDDKVEIAFDRCHSFRSVGGNSWVQLDERIWNGHQLSSHEKYTQQELYGIQKEPDKDLLLYMAWPRAGTHDYWWQPKDEREDEEFLGRPEDFRIVGREQFRGKDCWRLECDWYFRTWYVGVTDHRLYGQSDGVTLNKDHDRIDIVIQQVAKECGAPATDGKEYDKWFESLAGKAKHDYYVKYWKALRPFSRLQGDFWTDDYKQVAPGCWMPMMQGYNEREEENSTIDGVVSMQVTDVHVNKHLPDALFQMEFAEGIDVNDWAHDPPLQYKYKKHFTADEWNAILAKGAENAKAVDAYEHAGDGLIGKPAIAFPTAGTWINSAPLTLNDLKGKVVILDFFSESCGPCRNDLPALSDLYKNAKSNGLTIIGIHTAGSDPEKIHALIKEFDLQYPIYVDAIVHDRFGWGELVDAYKVQAIPQTFVIGPDGKLAGHGTLAESLSLARSLVTKSK